MPLKLAANLSFLYQELSFLDRFAAAADDGFTGVECLFPYAFDPEDIRRALDRQGLTQVLFNFWPGDLAKGERGYASLARHQREFRASLEQGFLYAAALDCDSLHLMAGLRDPAQPYEAQYATYRENLAFAARVGETKGIRILIEPINPIDMPGYFLNDFDMAATLIREIDHPNLGLQFDFYHAQRLTGDLVHQYRKLAPLVSHIQIANPPDRHEPGNGEINYPYIFGILEQAGYSGWIGCEYKPSRGTRETLGWARPYLSREI